MRLRRSSIAVSCATGLPRRVMQTVSPTAEAVRKLTIAGVSAMHPSSQLLRSFLRIRGFLNANKDLPHAEERPAGASRSTHSRDEADFLTASVAWATNSLRCA